MKLFRYRRPSLKTLLGVTKAKKRPTKGTWDHGFPQAVPGLDQCQVAGETAIQL